MTDEQREMQLYAVGCFVAGVCTQLAESRTEAERVRAYFAPVLTANMPKDDRPPTRAELRRLFIAVSKKAIEVLEGSK